MVKRKMEPPIGFMASLWHFICFLPYFIGLLFLGIIKGIILCPFICLSMTIGNSAIILGLLPAHAFWTYYCVLSTKQLGPVLKLVLCICLPAFLVIWAVAGIVGSVIGGLLYGFLSPIFATFDAVGEGKTNVFFHSFYDGTWSTIKGCFTVVRDFSDVCFHSYFSYMDDLRQQVPPSGKYYEIRLLLLPGAVTAALLGVIVDFPAISIIAIYKSPYMLFKGWHRLFHDLIGREGPFLETICVPFAGLAILLWPLAVVGAVSGSVVSSIFLGAYAGVIVYQESSFSFGLCYIVASLSIYDEYSNDVLDLPEGSCFPRPQYRKDADSMHAGSQSGSLSRPNSIKNPPTHTLSINTPMVDLKPLEVINTPMVDLKPLELLERLFKECQRHGEVMVSEGLITPKDIEDAKSSKGSRVVSVGLPAYGLFQAILRSAKANSAGILLGDNVTEITATNRPRDTFYDWFLSPFLIMKEQIKAENLSDEEEDYLGKLVLLCGEPERLKSSNIGSPPVSEVKRAELDALARRLQGITKSISRFPTFRRNFDRLVKSLSEELARMKDSSRSANGGERIERSRSAFARMFSQKSLKRKTGNNGSDQESDSIVRDVEVS